MTKNNLSYYSHSVGSHLHWKFKLLRKKYKWCGEGKFWALNNIIAESENCILDISDENKAEQIAADLDFELPEFLEFVAYLESRCKLIKKEDSGYTSKRIQGDLKKVIKTRESDRVRKSKSDQE